MSYFQSQEDQDYEFNARYDYYSEIDHGGDTLETLQGEAESQFYSVLEAVAAVIKVLDEDHYVDINEVASYILEAGKSPEDDAPAVDFDDCMPF